jgi:hypothetical protein
MFVTKYVVEVLGHKGVGQSRYEAGDSSLGHVVKLDILEFKALLSAPPRKHPSPMQILFLHHGAYNAEMVLRPPEQWS